MGIDNYRPRRKRCSAAPVAPLSGVRADDKQVAFENAARFLGVDGRRSASADGPTSRRSVRSSRSDRRGSRLHPFQEPRFSTLVNAPFCHFSSSREDSLALEEVSTVTWLIDIAERNKSAFGVN